MTGNNYRFERILEMIPRSLAMDLLGINWIDLGCHQGQFLKLVYDKFRIKGYGVDFWAPKDKNKKDTWYYYRKMDIESCWPISWNEKFHMISALEVIEHIIDTDKFLKNIRDHLSSDGTLILSTPNISCLRNRVMGLFGVYPYGLEYRNVIHHVRLYNSNKLKEHLEEHGFKVLAMKGVNFLPYSMLDCNLLRKVSEWLADRLPSLCNNLICVAKLNEGTLFSK